MGRADGPTRPAFEAASGRTENLTSEGDSASCRRFKSFVLTPTLYRLSVGVLSMKLLISSSIGFHVLYQRMMMGMSPIDFAASKNRHSHPP